MQTEQLRIVSALSESDTRKMAESIALFSQVIDSVASNDLDKTAVPTTLFVMKNADWPLQSGGVFQRGRMSNLMVVPEPADYLQTPYATLLHEYVHFVQMSNGGADFPPWYTEGLAEVLSSVLEVGNQIRLGLVFEDRFYPLREGAWIPLKELLELTRDSPRVRHGTDPIFYSMSNVLVHYLMIGNPQRKAQLNAYLQQVTKGVPSAEAFRSAFQIDIAVLEDELRGYVRQERMKYITLPRSSFPGAKVKQSGAISCVQALSETSMALTSLRVDQRVVRSKWIERAAREDAQHPAVLMARALSFEANDETAAADDVLDKVVRSAAAEPRWKWLAAEVWLDRAQRQTRNFNAPPAEASELAKRAATVLDATHAGASKDVNALYAVGVSSLLMGGQNDRGLSAIAAASHITPTSADLAWVGALLSERDNKLAQADELWSVVAWYGQTAQMRNRAIERRKELAEVLKARKE